MRRHAWITTSLAHIASWAAPSHASQVNVFKNPSWLSTYRTQHHTCSTVHTFSCSLSCGVFHIQCQVCRTLEPTIPGFRDCHSPHKLYRCSMLLIRQVQPCPDRLANCTCNMSGWQLLVVDIMQLFLGVVDSGCSLDKRFQWFWTSFSAIPCHDCTVDYSVLNVRSSGAHSSSWCWSWSN